MEELSYKGYKSTPKFSTSDQVWFGQIDNIADLVSYEANDKQNLEEEFHNAVDDYLEDCQSIGKDSNLPTY